MSNKELKNKPLIEAVFELRWKLEEINRTLVDRHFNLLIGRIYDKVSNEYPYYEKLPSASIPDEISPYFVKYRFRKSENQWPLIQIGPGIITLNDTDNYKWEDFFPRIRRLLEAFYQTYPEIDKLKINNLLLRYIDAVIVDISKVDIFNFIKENLKLDVMLHNSLFENPGLQKIPFELDLRFSFESKEPEGLASLRIARGLVHEKDAIIWETILQSSKSNSPQGITEVQSWINNAHDLVIDWFFKMIAGNLEKGFE